MPQLDLFTLLFQFKSFFLAFVFIYLLFLLVFIPKLHFIITLRRVQILSLLNYYNFLKILVYFSFSSQCSILKFYFITFNQSFSFFFNKFLDSKLGISNFLFSRIYI